MLWHSDNPGNLVQLKGAEVAARTLGMQFEQVPVRSTDDFDAGFTAMRGADGVLQANTPLFTTHRARLVGLAAKSRLPVIYGQSGYVEIGGLMSYGRNIPDQNRHAATYVAKILKGAKPADLSVEQPTKFELAINNKTAQGLRSTIPRRSGSGRIT